MPKGRTSQNGPPTATAARRRRGAPKAAEPAAPAPKARPGRARQEVVVEPIRTKVLDLTVEGLTPLIVSRFGSKARRMILEKQQKKPRKGRDARVPFEEFLDSLYLLPGKRPPRKKLSPGQGWKFQPNTYGVAASAFKGAMVAACSFVQMPKTVVRGAVHVLGDLLPLKYKRLVMREDVVRIGPWSNKVADLRFRGEFQGWSCRLSIRYNETIVSAEQVVNLVEHSGFAVGVGEWRPEKEGSHGTFRVKRG